MKWKKEHKLSHIAKNMNFCNALEKAAAEHAHENKMALWNVGLQILKLTISTIGCIQTQFGFLQRNRAKEICYHRNPRWILVVMTLLEEDKNW